MPLIDGLGIELEAVVEGAGLESIKQQGGCHFTSMFRLPTRRTNTRTGQKALL